MNSPKLLSQCDSLQSERWNEIQLEVENVSASVEDDSCSVASYDSKASTINNGHESFETFQHKVKDLVRSVLMLSDEYTIETDYIRGGSFNRVVGITIIPAESDSATIAWKKFKSVFQKALGHSSKQKISAPSGYVLRIPRRCHTEAFEQDRVNLEFVSHQVPYPVPRVVAHSQESQNPIGTGYLLQTRIAGQSLTDLFPSLNAAHWRSATRQITQIMMDIGKITNPCPGLIDTRNTTNKLKHNVRIAAFPIMTGDFFDTDPTLSKPQTTYELLMEMFRQQQENYGIESDMPTWERVQLVITQMHNLGLLPDEDHFHLVHLDIAFRNLMATITSDTEVQITGIIDWDETEFAPKFVSHKAPIFLWAKSHWDEEQALEDPEDLEDGENKKIFEQMAGPEYLKYAYGLEYIVARVIWQVLRYGMGERITREHLIEYLDKFEKLHPPEASS
ncbi:hypothetical protein BDV96DRAFT_651803 [Lophiotrema nucula]|uniref:Aminoglycoside phosphotransferase domain-containing protein n=1 Tax=Lophiotrema nucula TaxID=690887 RepID=A0A6A5YQF0_9PLEO|nr:hypothetical protein BDV96DRAFT_651803 [Lophiotrema nucula]